MATLLGCSLTNFRYIELQNGFLESYSSTINGSEMFYSCDPGHFPERRMSTVCTEHEWILNPGDFICTIGMLYGL